MEEWKECKLGDLVTVKGGKRLPKGINLISTKNSHPYIRIRDLGKSKYLQLNSDYEYVDDETQKSISRYITNKGDVLISIVGTIGLIGIVGESLDNANLTENCVKLIDLKNIDSNYLYYFLSSEIGQNEIKKGTVGAVQPKLPIKNIQDIDIPIPPLPTQQKIATILSSLDDKIELNNKINTNLEQQIEALLFNYLSKRETTSVKLGDYLYIKGRIGWKGLKKNEYLSESNYRIINGETLTKSGIDWNKAGYISEERYTESPEIMLQVGDILLSKDGTIGKIGYVDELELPTSVASGIFVIRNNNPSVISTTFIYYLLKSKLFDSFIIARTEGSVIPHLYQKDFMDFEFPLPSPKLMNEFEKTTSPMFNQIINNLTENKKLTSLRDSLLPKLMNGEIKI